ncbi:hypothetical protein CC1G_13672 [Coprinopsis cinerea okayama7|uniref:Chromo domain-containing protein n=1 Tax=Coprinopsis cinerea (strain Okayama-7 / 130 / ATCC MYA-4618 / FGSC 9003) TaxID=240176 RepID=D6RJV4_COPC7|nr:hypothetical protein CC1G_13672 [Coprinopsis cinerea okayama7\|eukprot:XP_002912140.1 hypothetical protein CC1G_13672 [Coprinopsis cinerea okayama7\
MGKSKVKQLSAEEEEEVYIVEVIVAAKVVADTPPPSPKKKKKRGRKSKAEEAEEPESLSWRYEVKWAGYPDDETTWEPEDNLGPGCMKLLERFWAAVGTDNQDYPKGYVVQAPQAWIKKEKERFAKDLKKEKEKKASSASVAREAKEKEEPLEEPKSLSAPKVQVSEESDGDSDASEPLAKRRKTSSEPKSHKKSQKGSRKETAVRAKVEETTPPLPSVPKSNKKRVESTPVEPTSPNLVPSLFSDDDVRSPDASPQATPVPVEVPPLPTRPAAPPVPVPAPNPAPPPLPSRMPFQSQVAPKPQTLNQPVDGPSTGISAKQRIAKHALDPLPPKTLAAAPHSRPTHLPPTTMGSTSIMTTGFRKSIPTPAIAQRHFEPTLASINARPASPPPTEPPNNEPPSRTAFEPSNDIQDLFPRDDTEFGSSVEVDQFLQSAMPKELAEAYPTVKEAETSNNSEPVPPPALPAWIAAQTRQKKACWTGSLSVPFGGSDSIQFKVAIEDEVEIRKTGFRFPFALSGSGSQLAVQGLYDLVDIRVIVGACRPPAYRAQVSRQPQDENDTAWSLLIQHMIRKQQVALVPLTLSGQCVAILLIHPAITNPLSIATKFSVRHVKNDGFVAELLPWSLTAKQISEDAMMERNRRDLLFERCYHALTSEYDKVKSKRLELERMGQAPRQWESVVKRRPLFQLAIRVLGFPTEIYEYLKLTTRHYAIISPLSPQRNRVAELESELLHNILQRVKRETPPPKDSVKDKDKEKARKPAIRMTRSPERAGMLFIHVSALQNLDKLPYFRERILSKEYIRMYMFGSNPSCPSSFWGLHEIYPCGGVVTLTPGVILRRPFELPGRLKEINEHPLWTVYVCPAVIGMIATLCNAKSPNQFLVPYILNAISRGEMALLEAPPEPKTWSSPRDTRTSWLREYMHFSSPTPEDVLLRGIEAFNSRYANLNSASREARLEEDVVKDLKAMQRNPAIAKNYRRYVLLTSSSSDEATPLDSIERTSPMKFDFKDGFSLN